MDGLSAAPDFFNEICHLQTFMECVSKRSSTTLASTLHWNISTGTLQRRTMAAFALQIIRLRLGALSHQGGIDSTGDPSGLELDAHHAIQLLSEAAFDETGSKPAAGGGLNRRPATLLPRQVQMRLILPLIHRELWRKLGDDGVRRAAYRGGCRACQNLFERAIRHERDYQHCLPASARHD
jgi:hypothetical protein